MDYTVEFHFGGEEQIEIVSSIYFEFILIFLVIFARIIDFPDKWIDQCYVPISIQH